MSGKCTDQHFSKEGSEQLFYNVSGSQSHTVLRSRKNLTFHVWTSSDTPVHIHENYWEIFIVTSGMLLHQTQDSTTIMRPGDAFLVCPGQCHQHRQYKNHTSQHINLTCASKLMPFMWQLVHGSEESCHSRQAAHLNNLQMQTVIDLQNVILHTPAESSSQASVASLFSFALGIFCRPEGSLPNTQEFPDWLVLFLQKLQNVDFSAPVSMQDIYAMSGRSQPVLSHAFKAHTGQTIVSYINDLKLSHACSQLRNTTFSLSDIAKASGYESYPHFCRLFKRRFGLTPLQYRASNTSDKL